jgi:putative ABC transport system substrate-binding protein
MKNCLWLLTLSILFSLIACHPTERKLTIGYIQISQDASLDTARAGVFRALADSGFVPAKEIRVLDNNAQGDLAMINTILLSLQSQRVDLVITNGTPCMIAAMNAIRNVPVVFTVAFSPGQLGIEPVPDNLYGVFDNLNPVGFADLVTECIPSLKVIGIPYNNAEANAEYAKGVMKREFESRGITVLTVPVTSTNDLMQAVQSLAGRHVQAFVSAADNTVNMGLPVLAGIASKSKIPLFVSDPPQAEKGAAIGYGCSYYSWGYRSGQKAAALLKGTVATINRMEPNRDRDLVVNLNACANQGLTVPRSVLDKATKIIK